MTGVQTCALPIYWNDRGLEDENLEHPGKALPELYPESGVSLAYTGVSEVYSPEGLSDPAWSKPFLP